jgi:hypothetical protein
MEILMDEIKPATLSSTATLPVTQIPAATTVAPVVLPPVPPQVVPAVLTPPPAVEPATAGAK